MDKEVNLINKQNKIRNNKKAQFQKRLLENPML